MRFGVAASGDGNRQRLDGRHDRVARQQALADFFRHVHRGDLGAPDVVDVRSGLVLRQAPHDFGGLDQCVVGSERHRPVTRGAMNAQSSPRQALLADVDGHRAVAVIVGTRPAAQLREHVVGGDRIPVVLDHPLGAPHATGLFITDAEVDQVALGSEPFGRQASERNGHRRRQVEHVDGASTPHFAVDHLATERVFAPTVGVDRHHVGVGHEAQRWRVGIGPLDPSHHRVAPLAWSEPLDLETGAFEVGDEQVGVPGLVARIRRPVVDARVADQRLQQLGGGSGELVRGCHGRTLVLSASQGSGSGRPMPVTTVRQISSMRPPSSGVDALATSDASHS